VTRSDPTEDPAAAALAEPRARLRELGLERALPAEALSAAAAVIETLIRADDALGREPAPDAPQPGPADTPEDDDGTAT
jgi:hypothetical protein